MLRGSEAIVQVTEVRAQAPVDNTAMTIPAKPGAEKYWFLRKSCPGFFIPSDGRNLLFARSREDISFALFKYSIGHGLGRRGQRGLAAANCSPLTARKPFRISGRRLGEVEFFGCSDHPITAITRSPDC
jgi:hypothetical protein